MIPVPRECAALLKYNEIANYRSFSNEKEKTDYIYILQKEKAIIDRIAPILESKAKKLYHKYIENPFSALAVRCCNFPLLEEKCRCYDSPEIRSF